MQIKNNLRLNNKMSAGEELEYLRGVVKELEDENTRLKHKMEAAGMPVSRA